MNTRAEKKANAIKCIMARLTGENALNRETGVTYKEVKAALNKLTAAEANSLAVMIICKMDDLKRYWQNAGL